MSQDEIDNDLNAVLLPQCPKCKKSLSLDYPKDKSFTCKNCGCELIFRKLGADEEVEWGKICLTSEGSP